MSLTSLVRKIQPIKKFISNSVLTIGFLINTFLAFCAGSILGMPLSALAAEISSATQRTDASDKIDAQSLPMGLLNLISKEKPLRPSPGIIRKISEYPHDRTIAVFCATALDQHGEDHEKFIYLIRDELVDKVDEDIGSITGVPRPYFVQSMDREEMFSRCLEQNLSTSSQETLYRLLQIEWVTHSDKTRAYRWLVKLADDGHIPAKYLLAKEIILAAGNLSHKRGDLRKYITVSADNYHRLLLSVAGDGNKQAQFDLVHFYLGYYGTQEWDQDANFDAGEAVRWLKSLATQEQNTRLHDAAIELLGSLYYFGTEKPGDGEDYNQSFRRHKKDQEYNPGKVIKIDRHVALNWLEKIPEDRLVRTCSAAWLLSKLYRSGDVVEANLDKADRYFSMFARGCIKP